jgi:hypothetical protein
MVTRPDGIGPRLGGVPPRVVEAGWPETDGSSPPAGRYDAWRTAPLGETDPQVAGWVHALPRVGKALERVALEAIGAALIAWKGLDAGRSEQRDQVLQALGRWLQSAMPWLPRGDQVGERLRQQVPGLMRQSGGDPRAAAQQLYRGLERGEVGGEVGGARGPASRDRPASPGAPPQSGPRRPPTGRSPPPGQDPRPGGPAWDAGAGASPERSELDRLRRELASLHAQWQRAPRAFTDAQIRAGGQHVPDALLRRLDAVAARPGVADAHPRALGEVRGLARRLDEAALRYTVHRVIAGHERVSPAALQALRGLAQDRLRGGDWPGGGDAALLRGLAATRARGAEVTHTRGPGSTHGTAAGEGERRARERHEAQLEQARQERLRARRHELPGVDRERAHADTAARHGVSEHVLRQSLQPAQARWPFGIGSGPAGGPSDGPRGQAGQSGGTGEGAFQPQPIQGRQQSSDADRRPPAEEARQRFERFTQSFPAGASHLVPRVADGGFDIRPDALNPSSREAYNRLADRLGAPRLNALANAMVLGYQGRIGLAALGRAWQDATADEAARPALTGGMLADLGKVVFDEPSFGTLQDLAALTGIETGTYRGLLHPDEDFEWVAPFFEAVVDGIFHFRGLTTSQPDAAQILASPWFLDHLRAIQMRLDQTPVVPGSGWPPWPDSRDPDFQATIASRQAIWLAWWSAGLDDARLQALPGLVSPTWAQAVAAVPELARLDLARTFDGIDRALRSALPQVLEPYDPEMNALYVGQRASQLARATFADEGLRDRLFQHLRTAFDDPRAVTAYGRTPDFTEYAAGLATEGALEDAGLTRSWVRALMHEALLGQASVLRRGPAPGETRPLLAALERLAIGEGEPERRLRQSVQQQMRLVQSHHEQVLQAVARFLADWGFVPTDPSPSAAGSLRDAVLRQLNSARITARLEPAMPGGSGPTFVIEREPGPIGRDGTPADGPMLSLARREVMERVIGALTRAGFPTDWRFATDGR